ncbi:hypothetical protein GCM10020331_021820 [Ectobacillus funiculus]
MFAPAIKLFMQHSSRPYNKKASGAVLHMSVFGAGQKVSQIIYEGNDWKNNKALAKEMFAVFPIMQQLQEMLWYLQEALGNQAARPIYNELLAAF